MGTFSTKSTLHNATQLLPQIASNIADDFKSSGYEVKTDELSSGGYDISITKGGVFKAVLGMKTALKVTLISLGNDVSFEAGVGIWGQQAIPTIISMLIFWPVLITQIWGMVEQSKLDDRALSIANKTIADNAATFTGDEGTGNVKFCTNCGARNLYTAKFCSQCGKPL